MRGLRARVRAGEAQANGGHRKGGGTSVRHGARTTRTAVETAKRRARRTVTNPPHRLHTAHGPSIDSTPPHRLRAIVMPENPLQHHPGTGRLRTGQQFL